MGEGDDVPGEGQGGDLSRVPGGARDSLGALSLRSLVAARCLDRRPGLGSDRGGQMKPTS